MIDEAMHGSILTVCILIHKAWNEIRCDSNYKSLRDKKNPTKQQRRESMSNMFQIKLIQVIIFTFK